ncbi:hypothetical protein ACET3Z_018581 [Daucus carota]
MSLGVHRFVPGQYVDATQRLNHQSKRWHERGALEECLHLMVCHYHIEVLVLMARRMLLARYSKCKKMPGRMGGKKQNV